MKTREIKVLEDICPFCGAKTGEATITLAPSSIIGTESKAIGNACPKCEKHLKAGCIGFLSPSGEGVIMQKDTGLEIMENLKVRDLYVEDAMTVVRVGREFWNRQFKSIVDRRIRIKKKIPKRKTKRRKK
jgi:hypothetical protein